MVTTYSQQYTMPVINESGYVIVLPNVQTSEDIFRNPHPDPLVHSSVKEFPLGTKLVRAEQVWRYCYAGDTNLNIAAPIQSGDRIHDDSDEDIKGLSITAIGSNIVYLTSATNIRTSPADEINEYEDGYLYFNDATGQGQCRKIKSNEGFSGTLETKFVLYEALTIATAAGVSEAGIVRNPYRMVEKTKTVVTGMAVGVPGIAVTANYYFWSQTGGPCAVVLNATMVLGTAAIVGTAVGKVNPGASFATEVIIGWPMSPSQTDTQSGLIYLTID